MDRYVRLISNLNVQGDLELGSTVTLSADLNTPFAGSGLSDMDDAARVEYQIGTQRLMVSEVAPYSVSFPLILTDLNAESKLSVVATVYDQAQNSRTATQSFDTLVDLPPSVESRTSQRRFPTGFDEYRIGVKGYDDRCLESLELVLSGACRSRSLQFPASAIRRTGRKNIRFISMCRWMRLMGEGLLMSLVATDSASQLVRLRRRFACLGTPLDQPVESISPRAGHPC